MTQNPTSTVAGALDTDSKQPTEQLARAAQIITELRALTTELETILTEQEK